jgi:arginine deiminase
MNSKKISVNLTSEVGKLKSVLVHRPGKELERLTPDYLETLLFDDIPWLKKMREEHDNFTKLMTDRGVRVLYIEDLLLDCLKENSVREKIVGDMISDSKIHSENTAELLWEKLLAMDSEDLASMSISGLTKDELELRPKHENLWDIVSKDFPFYITPSPNLYFMRDPLAVVGNRFSINSMRTTTRRREARMISHVIASHPLFKGLEEPWYNPDLLPSIEGGDMLVLSSKVMAIGCSERTTPEAIELFAKNLLGSHSGFERVLVFDIPKNRAFMHLDTVFTMIDWDVFSIYPGIEKALKIYEIKMSGGGLTYDHKPDAERALKDSLGLPAVKFIRSGGGDLEVAAREQWNDSTNTFAIAPGVVLAYSRNERSNDNLRKHGIEVLEFEGSELERGRGGSRCMTCPLEREAL